MVDASLRCDETFRSPLAADTPSGLGGGHHHLLPHFCRAYDDRTILGDRRVISNMLALETFYVPGRKHYQQVQDEIKLHMRKVVVEWMLEVCLDQRCPVDVFLLAVNIVDRFLDTIKLKKRQFQLLGAAGIFLASKMLEPSPIPATTLVKYTADTYDREELLVSSSFLLTFAFETKVTVSSYSKRYARRLEGTCLLYSFVLSSFILPGFFLFTFLMTASL